MRINPKLLCAICVTLIAVIAANGQDFFTRRRENAFAKHPGEKVEAFVDINEDSRHISLYLANRFQLAAVARMMLKVPDEIELELQYSGILRIDTGTNRGRRVCGSIGLPTRWTIQVVDGSPVFEMAISNVRTPKTRFVCQIEKEQVFVSVPFIQGIGEDPTDDEIKKKRASLGNLSVHDMLKLLEAPADELEKATPE